jgi:preprotein translocase subunit YajC
MNIFAIYQAAPPGTGAGGLLGSILPILLIGLIFYFLLIRPQSKRLKEHRSMLDALQRGDEIITNGGLIGKVKKVSDDELTVNFGGTDMKVLRSMVSAKRDRKPAND